MMEWMIRFLFIVVWVDSTFPFMIAYNPRRAIFVDVSSASTRLQATGSGISIQIRDWEIGEGEAILDFLKSAEDGSFNPEGALELDCQTESLLKESYNAEDGGCFVVAVLDDDDASKLVGTAGLIVGTPVEYQASGASQSSADTTAAIRRCCCRTTTTTTTTSAGVTSEYVLKTLMTTLEERAIQAQATQAIALAYPPKMTFTTLKGNSPDKPTPQLLEQLGYERLPQQLPGVEAVQYGKSLLQTSKQQHTMATPAETSTTSRVEKTSSSIPQMSDLAESAIAIGALGILLAGFLSVAQFIGFDTTVISSSSSFSTSSDPLDSINRGLGRPLSSEDLGQLLQDEKLQRKTLDGGNVDVDGTTDREWKDLSLEEQREEMALLQIINGQDIRIK